MINKLLSSFSLFFFIIFCLSHPCLLPATTTPDNTGKPDTWQHGPVDSIISDSKASQLTRSPAPPQHRGDPMTLTYAFSPDHMIDYISKQEIEKVFVKAFGRWSEVIPVTFRVVDDYESADIPIGWYAGDHGDGHPFDGAKGVLAHAHFPEYGRLIHFDAAEIWAVADSYKGTTTWMRGTIDLESAAVHEIGHALGLRQHSQVKGSVMYPTLNPRTKRVHLAADDVERVQAIYGSNPNFRFGLPPPSPSKKSSGSDEGIPLLPPPPSRKSTRYSGGILRRSPPPPEDCIDSSGGIRADVGSFRRSRATDLPSICLIFFLLVI